MGSIEVGGIRVDADPLNPRSRSHREQIRQIRLGAQMVFQEFNLFPHLRVIDNLIEAPIRVKGLSRDEAIATAEKFLDKVGLSDKRDEFPSRLSGGQKQRVALAAALVGRPQVAFLDEPTAGLDPHARLDAWDLLRETRDTGCAVIVTTHSFEEAERLADHIVIVNRGSVAAQGSIQALTADRSLEIVYFSLTREASR